MVTMSAKHDAVNYCNHVSHTWCCELL